MKNLTFIISSTLIILLMTGCTSFNGQIRFKNNSDKEIWINEVSGFSHQPPVGILTPGKSKGASMPSMKFPDEVIINWSYNLDEDGRQSIVLLQEVTKPQGKNELLFQFTSEYLWKASNSKP